MDVASHIGERDDPIGRAHRHATAGVATNDQLNRGIERLLQETRMTGVGRTATIRLGPMSAEAV